MSKLSRLEFAPDLVEQVYQRLLNAICNGELAPAARLTQEDLAAAFDVSRQPVLQALRLLRKDGFVIDVGRRGLQVAPVDAQMISRIYEVRAVLDGLAARQAAHARAHIDPALVAAGRAAVAGTDIGAMINADLAFHNAIYAASGNPLIAETANHHWRHIRRAMGAVLQQARVRDSVWDEHRAMIEAIAAGDEARAEALARQHGEEAGRNLVTELGRQARAAS
jgi:DNA-binding GntR family transcriptional regulator